MARPTPADSIRLLPRDAYLFDPASHALLDEVLEEGRLPRSGVWQWRLILALMVVVGLGLTLHLRHIWVEWELQRSSLHYFTDDLQTSVIDRWTEETIFGTRYFVSFAVALPDGLVERLDEVTEDFFRQSEPGAHVGVMISTYGDPPMLITFGSIGPEPPWSPTALTAGWWMAVGLAVIIRQRGRETLLEGEITRARLRRDDVDPDAHVVVINFDFLTPDGERAISGEDVFHLTPGSEMPAAGMPVIVRYRSPRRYFLL